MFDDPKYCGAAKNMQKSNTKVIGCGIVDFCGNCGIVELWIFLKIKQIYIIECLHAIIFSSGVDFVWNMYYKADSYIKYLSWNAGFSTCVHSNRFSTISPNIHNSTVSRHPTMFVRLKQYNHSAVCLWISSYLFFQKSQIWLCIHNCVLSIH